ncbi:uncharacterized protein LOC118205365 [Stegodyphus dumicola]|uniref:uncharacterized protein LOC118194208 n=1 Tax=Stegodyphus dumicola TaxID=202533 RepID=UPI0015B15514|nr:uncharacterized protein LOC118194208 [Stegodyphus dumicola]XP_035231589.1 uncharacterized protein LOC118203424 [Stegodyphus dumicola]XP_035233544.1 uncharacterized protein LOC118205365 [Stegodyphus dumicola]
MTTRHPKKGITIKNQDEKFNILLKFIHVTETVQFGKAWKPFQTGIIMSTLSVVKLSKELFSEGFTFFLPGRLTQDALENAFSQIRRKLGAKPTALQAKRALKLVCLSQFISDINNPNYCSESDHSLFDASELEVAIRKEVLHPISNSVVPSTSSAVAVKRRLPPAVEENDIHYIAGAIYNKLLKKKSICENCKTAMTISEDMLEPDIPEHRTILTKHSNKGGLKVISSGMYQICREAEREFQKCKDVLLRLQSAITKELVERIIDKCTHVAMPECCNLKKVIIDNFFITRCKGLTQHLINKRAHNVSYSSASANKKQKVK